MPRPSTACHISSRRLSSFTEKEKKKLRTAGVINARVTNTHLCSIRPGGWPRFLFGLLPCRLKRSGHGGAASAASRTTAPPAAARRPAATPATTATAHHPPSDGLPPSACCSATRAACPTYSFRLLSIGYLWRGKEGRGEEGGENHILKVRFSHLKMARSFIPTHRLHQTPLPS